MPRTRSLAWSELKLGVLVIVALVIASITIVMLTGGRGFFWQQYHLKVRFNNVAGLKPGSPVRIAGIPKGTVEGWDFADDQVVVSMRINRDVRNMITSESSAKLGSISLLGEGAVDITPSTRGTPIPEWGYIPHAVVPAQIADITDQASQGIQDLNTILHDLSLGKGSLGKFINDDQLYAQINRSLSSLTDITEGLKQGKGAAGKLLSDKQTADELDRSIKNLETVTAQLTSGKGSVAMLLNDEAFARSLSTATDNLQAIAVRINRGEGSAGKLITDTALYDKLESITNRLDVIVTQLNQGEGTIGQLLKDRQLYENMNKASSQFDSVLRKMDDLIVDIQKNPKKYFPNKISIF